MAKKTLERKIIEDFARQKRKEQEIKVILIRQITVTVCTICTAKFPENLKGTMDDHVALHSKEEIERGLLRISGAIPHGLTGCVENQREVFRKIGFRRIALEILSPPIQKAFLEQWKNVIAPML